MTLWDLLWKYINHGLTMQGATGELIGHTISISAMDHAINCLPNISICELKYQTPVTVIDYYKALLGLQWAVWSRLDNQTAHHHAFHSPICSILSIALLICNSSNDIFKYFSTWYIFLHKASNKSWLIYMACKFQNSARWINFFQFTSHQFNFWFDNSTTEISHDISRNMSWRPNITLFKYTCFMNFHLYLPRNGSPTTQLNTYWLRSQLVAWMDLHKNTGLVLMDLV